MASKRRLRRRACGHKQRFSDRPAAEAAMFKVVHAKNRRGGWLNVYCCRFCNGYHFGHSSSKRI